MADGWTSKSIMGSKRSQTQRTTYYMITFTWNVQKGQIYRDRKYICDCLGLGVETGSDCKWTWGIFLEWWKCSKIGLWWWLNNYVNLLKDYWIVHFNQVNLMVCKLYLKFVFFKWKNIYAKWKKPNMKVHMLYDPIYTNVQKRQVYRDKK